MTTSDNGSSSVARFEPLQFRHMDHDAQIIASRAFLNRMRERRTIRYFSREPVPFELIANAIATAGTAPSGANQQPWTFVVVSNPDLKRRIRDAAEAEEKMSYDGRMSQEWLEALAPLGTDWHKEHIEEAPYLVVVFEQAYGLATNADGSPRKIKHYYVQESVGIAVGFLLASLHQAGLATLTHTPSPMGFLTRILDRPQNERPFVLIPVGYPAADCRVPVITKKPLADIMTVID